MKLVDVNVKGDNVPAWLMVAATAFGVVIFVSLIGFLVWAIYSVMTWLTGLVF